MSNEAYTKEEKQVVKDWAVNWLKFFELLNGVTGNDKMPYNPTTPTDEDEITYQRMRLWFLDNELKFLPLWKDFCEYRKNYAQEKVEDIEDIDEDGFVAFMDNPFGYYYAARTLYTWAHHIGLQYSTIKWEPSEQEIQKVRPILNFLTQVLVDNMVVWVETWIV
ncbi:hypothetical protein ACFLWJ_01180 [Chloroflexota bacterium]